MCIYQGGKSFLESLRGIPSGPTRQVESRVRAPAVRRSWEDGHPGSLPLTVREKKESGGRVSKQLPPIANYLGAWDGRLPCRREWATTFPRKGGVIWPFICEGFKQAPNVDSKGGKENWGSERTQEPADARNCPNSGLLKLVGTLRKRAAELWEVKAWDLKPGGRGR